MSAAAAALAQGHIHLPSVHVRAENGTGFDYEEDLYVRGRGRRRSVERVVRLAVIEGGQETLIRRTVDELCPEELAQLRADLPILMDEGNPAATAVMEECARKEFARQLRIAAGGEVACARCGCSETRACSGGCVWATPRICSRCV
jgi:hypothetical protein